MHQGLYGSRHIAVDDEEVLLNTELLVLSFQVAGAIVFDPMAQDEILSARWRADRIGLYKAQLMECTS